MRIHHFALVILCLGFVTLGAAARYPAATRGVYYNGMVHYVSVEDGNPPKVAHWEYAFTPGDWTCNWGAHPTATLDLDKNADWLEPNNHDHGQGVAVMNGILHHFAVLHDPNENSRVYLTRYDLTQKKFLDYRKLADPSYPDDDIDGGGVAAAVMDSTLYVFMDNLTLTSTDGMNYTTLPALMPNHIPMDAATVFPPDAPPKIVVVYKNLDRNLGLYIRQWDSISGPSSHHVTLNSNSDVKCGALIQGTAKPPGSGHGHYFSAGAKDTPCLQLFIIDKWKYRIHRYEYHVNSDAWVTDSSTYDPEVPIDRFRVFPWYVSNYEPDTAGELQEVQRQYLAFTLYECTALACIFHDHQYWAFTSDVLVAQNRDPSTDGYGWEGIPTVTTTGDPEDIETLQKYWTLAGVVLGPPPYALNELPDIEIKKTSNVEYGGDQSTSVKHTQKWENSCMLSSGTSVSGGIGHVAHLDDELEIGFKHGWESKHEESTTREMGFEDTFGSEDESEGVYGTHGWAVFVCPTLVTQYYDVHAYNFSSVSSPGNYLGQSLHTITTGQIGVRAFGFQLASPGGDDDDVPGLLEGLPAYPSSLDLEGWKDQDWERTGAPWSVVAGTGQHGGLQAPPVSQGTFTQQHFSQTTKTVDSKGETSNVEVKNTFSIGVGLKIGGIKETLTAGYDSNYSTETETETEISTKIGYELHLPYLGSECTEPECVKRLEVQPFLLKATDYSAPWVPPGYDHQLPWCMTWQVTKYETLGGEMAGMTLPPEGASGTVVGSPQ